MKKFWNWIKDDSGERVLRLEGPIDEDSLWNDAVTPKAFRDELESEEGDVTVWLNSPGGNVFAASEIYTMLRDYKGKVTVKIDAIAASAASVIAMAGNHVAMSPTAMIMIHDPSTLAYGNTEDMQKAIAVLNEVKESIINAYCDKSGLSRTKVSNLMSNETWMNAKKAVELGFADEILFSEDREKPEEEEKPDEGGEDEPDKEPDKEPDEDGDDNGDDDEEEKKKAFQLQSELRTDLAACMYSSRQMGLRILNSLGVDTSRPPTEQKASIQTQLEEQPSEPEAEQGAHIQAQPEEPPAEPQPPADITPVIGLDGKTKDGAMPYTILMNQLECMR